MFTKKRKVIYSLIAATLLSSSAASATSFNYANIDYNALNNTCNNGTVKYSYNNNNYNKTNTVLDKYPTFNWSVITNKPTNKPGNVVVLPKPTTPTNPAPVPTPTPTPVPKPTPTPPATETPSVSGLSSIELEVVRLVNIERQKEGLQPLTASSELSNVARKKSEDMSNKNYFSHTSPTYGSPFDMMKSFGIKYNTAGENIAKGQLSAQSVVTAWMNSSGHRANIMNPSFNKIGVGHFKSSNGTNFWTQMFTN